MSGPLCPAPAAPSCRAGLGRPRTAWRLRVRTALLLMGMLALLPAGPGRLSTPQAHASATHEPKPPAPLDWDARERALIRSLGPWPAAALSLEERQAVNPLAGRPQAIVLGQSLFSDPRLSGNGQVSCASCHEPARRFTDGRPTSIGLADLERNTPSLNDLAGQRWFGWDGGSDSLWAASIRPLLDAREMGGSAQRVDEVLRADTAYRQAAQALKPFIARPADASEQEHSLVLAAMALGAWMETLQSPRTPFDVFRDALLSEQQSGGALAGPAASPLSAAAQRGLRLFLGKGNCSLCHGGPAFTHGEFHDIGIAFLLNARGPGQAPRVDPGRYRGIERVLADRYNQAGPWSPDPQGARARLLRQTLLQHRNWGEWKIPSLRQLRHSAPYMHAGSHASLREVIRHYSALNEERLHLDGEALLKPLNLSAREEDDLLSFLDSLSSP